MAGEGGQYAKTTSTTVGEADPGSARTTVENARDDDENSKKQAWRRRPIVAGPLMSLQLNWLPDPERPGKNEEEGEEGEKEKKLDVKRPKQSGLLGDESGSEKEDGKWPSFLSIRCSAKQKVVQVRAVVPLEQAERQFMAELRIREQALGPTDPALVTTLFALVHLYQMWSEDNPEQSFKKAERLVRRIENILAPNAPGGGGRGMGYEESSQIGHFYLHHGKYNSASPYFEEALAKASRDHGPESEHVASCLVQLARLRTKQGSKLKWVGKAVPMLEQALEIRQRCLPARHPLTAETLDDLAETYRKRGNYSKAEALHKQAASMSEQLYGGDHPDFARSLNCLALLYKVMERFQESESLYKRVLAIQRKALGAGHFRVAATLNNLANLRSKVGDLSSAEAFFLEGLAIKVLFPCLSSSCLGGGVFYSRTGISANTGTHRQAAMTPAKSPQPQSTHAIENACKIHVQCM
jgi:tetratricopeptide (TPR) repeat protein